VESSDARTAILKSYSEDYSLDYGDENYKPTKKKNKYLPVFVPEEEKKKSLMFFFVLDSIFKNLYFMQSFIKEPHDVVD